MRRTRSVAALAASMLAVSLVGSAPASGAAGDTGEGWGPTLPVSRSGADVWDVDLALNGAAGRAAWVRWGGDRTRVMTAVQRRTGGWTRPAAVTGTGRAAEVEIAYDGRGRAHLVWAVGRLVKASMLRVSGTWTRPVVLHETPSGPLGTRPTYLELSVNRGGAAVVGWQTMDDDEAPPYADSAVQAVTRSVSGAWSRARTLSATERTGIRPEVYVDRHGRATAVWGEPLRKGLVVRTRSRQVTGAGAWTPARALSSRAVQAGSPQLAGLPGGDLAVAFGFRGEDRTGVRVWRWVAGTGWRLSGRVPGGLPSSWIDAGLDRSGRVTVAYSNAADTVWAGQVSAAGVATRSRLVGDVSVYYGMHLAVNPAGAAVVAWDSVRGGDHPIEAAYRPAGGGWGPVARVSPDRGDAFLGAPAVDPAGDALVVWNGGDLRDPDSSLVWSRGYTAR